MLAEAQRHEVLAAMGIDVYLLRKRDAGKQSAAAVRLDVPEAVSPRAAMPADIVLVVACSRSVDADPATARLRAGLPLALGVAAARIGWIETDAAGDLPPPPAAPAYLALGTELARSLGAQLSTKQQMASVIAVADAPRACLANALAKRALWQALKPVARRLRQRTD
jgi:hypothetical protein